MNNFKKKIFEYINQKYEYSDPILLNELYLNFANIKKGTIRQIVRRLVNEGKIYKIKNGVYTLPNPNRILSQPSLNIKKVIENKYIVDKKGNRFGYKSGINFANKLGLTSQTASKEVIYSNLVANKKREVPIKNTKIIINASRVKVINDNYKLLQGLDLLNDFDKYSEYNLTDAKKEIANILNQVNMSAKEVESIVNQYPLSAQLNFYKIGGMGEITFK